jgi:hypothetical protein
MKAEIELNLNYSISVLHYEVKNFAQANDFRSVVYDDRLTICHLLIKLQ